MPELPKKKVGIVSCSGDELPEGTICLPLFLAGGEGDRAFAKFYPTIAVDGCELRCAARATEKYSSKPAASIMVREVIAKKGLDRPENARRLNEAGRQAVEAVADRIAASVDELLGKHWDRTTGSIVDVDAFGVLSGDGKETAKVATCSCGSGIPVQKVQVNGQEVTLIALPLIFEQFRQEGKPSSEATSKELLDTMKIYNPIPEAESGQYLAMLSREYLSFILQGSSQ
jgi:hypothetical protein